MEQKLAKFNAAIPMKGFMAERRNSYCTCFLISTIAFIASRNRNGAIAVVI